MNRYCPPTEELSSRPEDKHSHLVNHPAYYGGGDNPYEAIKIIEALDLNFNLGNAIKYIVRAGKKENLEEDLKKAMWYLNREVERNG